jgi:Sulfatase
MACITEAACGFPNGSGTIPPENGMLSEILGERGWNTYIVGKWHLTPTDEMNVASTRPRVRAVLRLPRRGDQPVAETNQWYPELVYDNHPVDQPRSPEEGYYLLLEVADALVLLCLRVFSLLRLSAHSPACVVRAAAHHGRAQQRASARKHDCPLGCAQWERASDAFGQGDAEGDHEFRCGRHDPGHADLWGDGAQHAEELVGRAAGIQRVAYLPQV